MDIRRRYVSAPCSNFMRLTNVSFLGFFLFFFLFFSRAKTVHQGPLDGEYKSTRVKPKFKRDVVPVQPGPGHPCQRRHHRVLIGSQPREHGLATRLGLGRLCRGDKNVQVLASHGPEPCMPWSPRLGHHGLATGLFPFPHMVCSGEKDGLAEPTTRVVSRSLMMARMSSGGHRRRTTRRFDAYVGGIYVALGSRGLAICPSVHLAFLVCPQPLPWARSDLPL